MIIIWGSRGMEKVEGRIKSCCVICHEDCLKIISIRRWFTFFFIPLFPFSSKKFYAECFHCKNTYKVKEDVDIEALLDTYSYGEKSNDDMFSS